MSRHLIQNRYPEAEIIIACARGRISPDRADRIRYQLQQKIDWSYLLAMADKHRVIPLLYHSLKVAGTQSIPPEINNELKMRFLGNTRANLMLTNEMVRLLEIFAADNINVIPYKGTVLSASIYGNIGFRQVWDIDILVAEKDVDKTRKLLLCEEYEIKDGYDREQSFFHPSKKVEVDLHWGLTPDYFPVNLDFQKLWSRRKPYKISGVEIQSFCPEDLLLILCLQVAKDCWERRQHLEQLAKVCDIAELLRNYRELDWSDITAEARGKGLQRILHFGLYLANGLLEAEIPETILLHVREDTQAVSLARQVCRRLFGEIDSTVTSPNDNSLFDLRFRLEQLLFYLKLRERPQDWMEHFKMISQSLWQSFRSSRNNGEEKFTANSMGEFSAENTVNPQVESDPYPVTETKDKINLNLEFQMAKLWQKKGKVDRAIAGYEKILEFDPANEQALSAIEELLIDDLPSIVSVYRKAFEHDPNNAELHKRHINLMMGDGELDAAFAYYQLNREDTKTIDIPATDLLCCVVVRNELLRLPYFLQYYREKGVDKFLIIDNHSTDDSLEFLLRQDDVYLWSSGKSFNEVNFGSVWFELLLRKYGIDRWCLTVDADELLYYPDCENKTIPQLCWELEDGNYRAYTAILLDMYSDRPVRETLYKPGENFLEVCPYFDRQYYHRKQPQGGRYKNQTIYIGGLRQRVFGETAEYMLNKVPLLKYSPEMVMIGGQHLTNLPECKIAPGNGFVLHFKYFSLFTDYVTQEVNRKEHYGGGHQYRQYNRTLSADPGLMLYDEAHSLRLLGSQQLIELGIMNVE